jgi:hypothetical protein
MGSKRACAASLVLGAALFVGTATVASDAGAAAAPSAAGNVLNPLTLSAQNHPPGAPSPAVAPQSVVRGPIAVGSELAELIPISGNTEGHFGWPVALSGNTAVIGAWGQTAEGNANQGVVYVYAKSGSSWVEQSEFTSSDGAAQDEFGLSVAISGSTIVVGAPNHLVGEDTSAGAAYVFTKSGSSWVQSAELEASAPETNADFGTAVSISGSTIAVTAPQLDFYGDGGTGAVYVFTKSGTKWDQKPVLTSQEPDDFYGASVSLSGSTLAVGAEQRTEAGEPDQGAVDIYALASNVWSLQASVTSGTGTGYLGSSVATTGSTVIAGATGQSEGEGAVYVYAKSGSHWSQQAELADPGGAGSDTFGVSVSLSGSTALIGASGTTINGNDAQGEAYLFTKSGTTWSEKAPLSAPAGEGAAFDGFGTSVSISSSTALVGSPFHTVGSDSAWGAVYVFDA